jgi:hypothetical protein
MKHFEASKALAEAYKFRTLTHHAGERASRVFYQGDRKVVLVFDTEVSRALLTSKSFAGFDYFREGIEHSVAHGVDLRQIQAFYDASMLFKEGAAHHDLKRAFHRMLEDLCVELDDWRPRFLAYFRKRRMGIDNALDFSNALVRLVAGLMVARLTSIPLKQVWRALALRRNIFYFIYHPSRQQATNDALRRLFGDAAPPEPGTHAWHARLLAQSLIVMGIDPLIGAICANLVDGQAEGFDVGTYRYCPTSFVSRVCIHPVSLEGIDYSPRDVCYAALLPAVDDENGNCPGAVANSASLAFGVGMHTCIGKHVSLVVLDLAETIYREVIGDGLGGRTEIAPDGAFLAFRNV